MESFLSSISPPLRNLEQIIHKLTLQDVQISDLLDPSFSASHLSSCNITHVGTQLRILRHAHQSSNNSFSPLKSTTTPIQSPSHQNQSQSPQQPKPPPQQQLQQRHNNNNSSFHPLDESTPFPKTFSQKSSAPSHIGLGMSVSTIESLQSPYLCKIMAILTPPNRYAWKKFAKEIGIHILQVVHFTFTQIPIISFELPIVLNMLIHTPIGARSQPSEHLNKQNVISRLLPQPHDPAYLMFHQASAFDVETLVLVFDQELLKAYETNPHHLALAMEESVALRLSTETDGTVAENETNLL